MIRRGYIAIWIFQDGGSATILENSNGDIAAAYRLIYSVFGSRMGFSEYGDNSFLTKFNRYMGENNARLARGVIRLVTSKVFLVLITRYVPNVAKRPKNVTVSIILTIDRLTADRFFCGNFQITISAQQVIRSTSCLASIVRFSGSEDRMSLFRVGKIQ